MRKPKYTKERAAQEIITLLNKYKKINESEKIKALGMVNRYISDQYYEDEPKISIIYYLMGYDEKVEYVKPKRGRRPKNNNN